MNVEVVLRLFYMLGEVITDKVSVYPRLIRLVGVYMCILSYTQH